MLLRFVRSHWPHHLYIQCKYVSFTQTICKDIITGKGGNVYGYNYGEYPYGF